jgi:tetratricopeptide (TPR) repeat protein
MALALLAGSLLSAGADAAQAQAAPTPVPQSNGLPVKPEIKPFQLVPGVGPTPGVIIQLSNPGVVCAVDARKAADGEMSPADAVSACNDAITSGALNGHDLAGSYANRGVLLMTMAKPADAKTDLNRALAIEPALAEAYVDRGQILIYEGHPAEGVADLDRGIALGPIDPERAYYHRGLGREDLHDIKGAYEDYKMAEQLRPGWAPVEKELSRFRVVSK